MRIKLHCALPFLAAALVPLVLADETADASNSICSVKRELYVASPHPGVSTSVDTVYVGDMLRRREIHVNQASSDLQEHVHERFSDDNGRTWSPLSPRKTSPDDLKQNGSRMGEVPYSTIYDPVSRKTIETFNRTIFLSDPAKSLEATLRGDVKNYDHAMYRLSDDGGRTWKEPRMFAYEAGASFNSAN